MITEQGWIEESQDLLRLNIIDWSRLNNYWDNPAEAVETIMSWLIAGDTHWAILKHNMEAAPERSDWPGWKHAGLHDQMGKIFWNWFHGAPNRGKIYFHDQPDFHGELYMEENTHRFYGDVGQVSASTFSLTLKLFNANDIWITVLDSQTQVVLEFGNSLREIWGNVLEPDEEKEITHWF